MYSWLLNILGVVLIGVLLDIILPGGKTNIFIKHIISLFVLYGIVNPIILFFNNSNIFSVDTNMAVDMNYIYENNLSVIDLYENKIEDEITKWGKGEVSVILNGNIFEEEFALNSAFVDVSKIEFDSENNKDDFIVNVKDLIFKISGVNKEDIVVYG